MWALGQRVARREGRATAFAAALAAVETYSEFPYRVRRRATMDTARDELATEISKNQAEIAFHQAWLDLEAPTAANAYRKLVKPRGAKPVNRCTTPGFNPPSLPTPT